MRARAEEEQEEEEIPVNYTVQPDGSKSFSIVHVVCELLSEMK